MLIFCFCDFMKQTNYWVWRIDPNFRPRDHNRVRELRVFFWISYSVWWLWMNSSSKQGCFSPLWVAFSILTGGLLLDVLISITLGVSALPVNIIIGKHVYISLNSWLTCSYPNWLFQNEEHYACWCWNYTHCTGVIVVLGLGTALRLALEFCHEWSFRRAVQRADANENHGYHPSS